MAYCEFQISSLSSANGTLNTGANKPCCFYGSLFGVTAYWIRLPSSAPPIGDMNVSTAEYGWGAFLETEGSTTPFAAAHQRVVPLAVAAFQRGDRWFRVTQLTGAATVRYINTAGKKKMLRVWYRGMNEGIGPTA